MTWIVIKEGKNRVMGVDAMMFARVAEDKALSEQEVKQLSWRICEALGREVFWVRREDDGIGNAHALSLYKNEYQDLDPPVRDLGSDQLIEVSLVSRYYGEHYERGPLMDFINIADWLEFNLPKGTQIYYGSDSSEYVDLFDKKERNRLFKHFAKNGHQPYRGSFSDNEYERYCEFCEHGMVRYGWGQGYAAYSCAGCGSQEETRDGGKTWEDKEK